MEEAMEQGQGPAPAGNPAEMVMMGLKGMLEAAPTPEVKSRLEGVMAELGDIAAVMENGGEAPEQMPAKGVSPVGGPQARPVGPGGV